jgi:hypothetical protein
MKNTVLVGQVYCDNDQRNPYGANRRLQIMELMPDGRAVCKVLNSGRIVRVKCQRLLSNNKRGYCLLSTYDER